jgi:hypothetical protein
MPLLGPGSGLSSEGTNRRSDPVLFRWVEKTGGYTLLGLHSIGSWTEGGSRDGQMDGTTPVKRTTLLVPGTLFVSLTKPVLVG